MKVRTIIALFKSILTMLAFIGLSFIFYLSIETPFNFVVASISILIGIYSSYITFSYIQSRGLMEMLAGNEVSSELDTLQPVDGDGVLELTAIELTVLFQDERLEIKPSKISIWGDNSGKNLNLKHHLSSIDFAIENSTLTLLFQDECMITIRNPRIIHHTSSYLKIVNAKEIIWHLKHSGKQTEQFNYLNDGLKIETNSNTKWKPKKFDLGIGMSALYLQV